MTFPFLVLGVAPNVKRCCVEGVCWACERNDVRCCLLLLDLDVRKRWGVGVMRRVSNYVDSDDVDRESLQPEEAP